MNFERQSSIHKILGGTEEEQKKALENASEKFSTPLFYEDVERRKTPEEEEVIAFVVSQMADFLQDYGVLSLPINSSHVHIFDDSIMTERVRDWMEKEHPNPAEAFCDQNSQQIVVFGWKLKSLLDLAQIVAHELIHFQSFNSQVINSPKNTTPRPHRVGLAVHPTSQILPGIEHTRFGWLNEAITEELNMRFDEKLRGLPMLKEDHEKVEDFRQKGAASDLRAIYTERFAVPEGEKYIIRPRYFSYSQEREKLNKLIADIFERHAEDFESTEDVFKVFVQAAMTGDLKELATLIDSTFGSGTFKKMAAIKESSESGS